MTPRLPPDPPEAPIGDEQEPFDDGDYDPDGAGDEQEPFDDGDYDPDGAGDEIDDPPCGY